MTKREIIMQIRSAKAAHIKWKSLAQIAIRGVISDKIKVEVPIVQTESGFGKWFYGSGMSLSELQSYNALEEPLEMIHETYIQIYTLQKAKLKGGFFSSKNQQIKKRQEEVDRLFANFNDYAKILVEGLNQLEIDVLRMSDQEIEKLY